MRKLGFVCKVMGSPTGTELMHPTGGCADRKDSPHDQTGDRNAGAIDRRLRVRYERRDDIHEAFLAIGCSLICLKLLHPENAF